MGCDCCNRWDAEKNKCTASVRFRKGFCGIGIDNKRRGTNFTKAKKKRKKKKKNVKHRH